MQIEQLKATTSRRLVVIDVNASLRAAALLFSEPGVGLVVVCNEAGEAAGVLSKSDLIRHFARPRALDNVLATLMSRPIIACGPNDDVHAVWQTMAAQNLQNMPVLGADAKPLGTLDIRNAMKVLFDDEAFQLRQLANYIAGVGYQ